jgi:hypothetical protein
MSTWSAQYICFAAIIAGFTLGIQVKDIPGGPHDAAIIIVSGEVSVADPSCGGSAVSQGNKKASAPRR